MIKVDYSIGFLRMYAKLHPALKAEVGEKIVLLNDNENHKALKVHKLHGKLKNKYSFSVNYRVRIIFEYITKERIVLHTIGNHDIY